MPAARKVLLSLFALVALAGITLGVLRWQADSAAASYPDAVRANLKRYEPVYANDKPLQTAIKQVGETGKRLPAETSTVEKAAALGPPAGRLFTANTRILRRETADVPELRKVPLAAVLSPKWKRMEPKAQAIDRSYAQALKLSREAEWFYPRIGVAWDRIARVIVVAPVLAQTLKATSELRKLATETWGGDPSKDVRLSIAERLKNDALFRRIIVATPMPASYAGRKQAVLDTIDRRAKAGRIASDAIRDRDVKAYKAVYKTYNENAEADYVGQYLRLCAELASLQQRFDEVAQRVTKQAAAL